MRTIPAGSVRWQKPADRFILDHPSGAEGYRHIAEKFDTADGHGPICVRRFVADPKSSAIAPEQWQQDAFGQADEWLRTLGLRQ